MAFCRLRALAFISLLEGAVLTTEDLLTAGCTLDADVLPFVVLRDEIPAEAWMRLAVAVLLFLLTVLLLPIPPLREDPFPNTLSEPVRCLDPYHTSL